MLIYFTYSYISFVVVISTLFFHINTIAVISVIMYACLKVHLHFQHESTNQLIIIVADAHYYQFLWFRCF